MNATSKARALARRPAQSGAALAISLFLLVIIILLGLAAVRSTQTGLRMARNSESRLTAQQSASGLVSQVLQAGNTLLPVNNDAGFRACTPTATASTLPLARDAGLAATCAGGGTSMVNINNLVTPGVVATQGYVVVQRDLPLFAESSVLREVGNSGRGYDFARYRVTGGYDASAEALGAAEVTESRLVPHVKDSLLGVTYD